MVDRDSSEARLHRLWREWQQLLQTAPSSDDCSDTERAIYRLLRAVPPFDEIDAELIHRESYPDPKDRPTMSLPHHWGLELADVLV